MEQYPKTFTGYNLMDCQPNNDNALYTTEYTNNAENVTFSCPTRLAKYQLIKDICDSVSSLIDGYLKVGGGPYDDATSDIIEAIDFIAETLLDKDERN